MVKLKTAIIPSYTGEALFPLRVIPFGVITLEENQGRTNGMLPPEYPSIFIDSHGIYRRDGSHPHRD